MTQLSPTVEDVARWMLDELERVQYLYQQQVVYDVIGLFGEHFSYINSSGNCAIAKNVLAEFNKLSGDAVVWEKGQRMWRKRASYDEPGRSQY